MLPPDFYGPWPISGYQVSVDFTDGVRLAVARDGRPLQSVPDAVRRSEDMAWIQLILDAAKQRQRELRDLLEAAMVEAHPLSLDDLASLGLDPAGRPFLAGLLLQVGQTVGLPLPEEWAFETLHGDFLRLEGPARIAHPVRLKLAGTLDMWQSWFGRRWFQQPFKQIRREIFLPDERDRVSRTFSARFSGHQVRWDQSRALLEGRGWYRVTKTGAERVFRSARLTAHLEFRTPASRGWSKEEVVLSRIFFLPPGEVPRNRANPGLPLDRVDPVAFSETLRDVRLVAAVAARGEEE